MGIADKLLERLECQSATLQDFRQLDGQRRARICVLEDALLVAKSERDKAQQDAIEAGELMKAEIDSLRQQLAEQQAETVDVRRQRNNETDRLNATNVVSVQQRDEIAYLRARLDEERSVIAGLRQQLDAQQQDMDAMRSEVERLRTFVGKVRLIVDGGYITMTCQIDRIIEALAELDAQPAPVAEAEGGK